MLRIIQLNQKIIQLLLLQILEKIWDIRKLFVSITNGFCFTRYHDYRCDSSYTALGGTKMKPRHTAVDDRRRHCRSNGLRISSLPLYSSRRTYVSSTQQRKARTETENKMREGRRWLVVLYAVYFIRVLYYSYSCKETSVYFVPTEYEYVILRPYSYFVFIF